MTTKKEREGKVLKPKYRSCEEEGCYICEGRSAGIKLYEAFIRANTPTVEEINKCLYEYIKGTPCNTPKSELFTLSWGYTEHIAKAIDAFYRKRLSVKSVG